MTLNNQIESIKIAAARAEGRTEGALRLSEEISRWFGKNTVPEELQKRIRSVLERYTLDQGRALDEFTNSIVAGQASSVHR